MYVNFYKFVEEDEFKTFLSVMEDKEFKTKYPKLHEMRSGEAKKVINYIKNNIYTVAIKIIENGCLQNRINKMKEKAKN